MRSFARNSFLVTAASLSQMVLGFLATVIITRHLTVADYGRFTMIVTAAALAATVALLGLPNIIPRRVARESQSVASLVVSIVPLLMIGIVIAALGLLAYVRIQEGSDGWMLGFMAVLILCATAISTCLQTFALGRQEMEIPSALVFGYAVIWCLFLALARSHLTLAVLVSALATIEWFRAFGYVAVENARSYFARQQDVPLRLRAQAVTQLLREGLPCYGSNLLAGAVNQLPVLFLGAVSGTVAVGNYGVGGRLVVPILLTASSVMTAAYPVLARMHTAAPSEFTRFSADIVRGIAVPATAIALVLGFLSPEVITLVVGADYAPAIPVFALQVWSVVYLSLHVFVGTVLLAMDREKLLLALSLVEGSLMTAANIAGAYYGAMGLAMTNWIGLILGLALHWHFTFRALRGVTTFMECAAFLLFCTAGGFGTFLLSNTALCIRLPVLLASLVAFGFVFRGQFGAVTQAFRSVLDRMGRSKVDR